MLQITHDKAERKKLISTLEAEMKQVHNFTQSENEVQENLEELISEVVNVPIKDTMAMNTFREEAVDDSEFFSNDNGLILDSI